MERDDHNGKLVEKINPVEEPFESDLVSEDVNHHQKLAPEVEHEFATCAPVGVRHNTQNNNLAPPYKEVRGKPLSKVPVLIASVYHAVLFFELLVLDHIEILESEPYREAWHHYEYYGYSE